MERTGLDDAYRKRSGCSLYTVEAHVRYLDEVARGSELTVRTSVLGADAKKVRFAHEMFVGEPGDAPVATEELFALHVDQGTGRSAPLPEATHHRLSGLVVPAPAWAGRGIREI
ncbi:hypothetical protein GCM10017688_46060 [Streptomyces ramulosus]